MPKWELAIAVADEEDLASGHKRKKEGDIIAVKPYPWNWGNKEVDGYFIVIVDGLTKEEAHKLVIPLYDDGRDVQPNIDIEHAKLIQKIPIAKRKYSIPLEELKKIDSSIALEKVRNKNLVYQPLKDKNMIIDLKVNPIIKNKYKEEKYGKQ